MLLASLSAAQKAGIGGMGAAFIVFALVSSLVIPRYRPDFPGRRVVPYVVLSASFLVAMMVVIVFVGREKSEARTEGTTPGEIVSPQPPAPPPAGNAAAGRQLFLASAQSCGGCHTFSAAGSTGTIGPNLDKLPGDAKDANRGSVEDYAAESIRDPNAYVVPGFPKGVMPVFGATLSAEQIADLVTFLTKKT